jgi:hypothetical protein
VLEEPVRVIQTITPGGTQTSSLCSVLWEIVQPASQIDWNLKDRTFLVFVREDLLLVILQ